MWSGVELQGMRSWMDFMYCWKSPDRIDRTRFRTRSSGFRTMDQYWNWGCSAIWSPHQRLFPWLRQLVWERHTPGKHDSWGQTAQLLSRRGHIWFYPNGILQARSQQFHQQQPQLLIIAVVQPLLSSQLPRSLNVVISMCILPRNTTNSSSPSICG